ncbi:hypothetical protein ACFS32_15650 [Novosphingobium pokkalii]|uniref:hypothetical protein n=1 Tax=Novosphingobium pokkalii TaxID=1770194 RepID=UPI00362703AB
MLKRPALARRLLRRLARETSAVTVIELGVSLPFLMVIALGSMEMVNLGILHVRLNQLAISVADNASRAKQSVVGGAPMFREYDVNQVFTGAALSVDDLDFPTNGRVILSSLETNSSGGQWIHWQRCWGNNTYVSRYGVQGTGATGTSFAGMGQPGAWSRWKAPMRSCSWKWPISTSRSSSARCSSRC